MSRGQFGVRQMSRGHCDRTTEAEPNSETHVPKPSETDDLNFYMK
jgi:hypothetical protein